MIWERYVTIIVMLSNIYEGPNAVCSCYTYFFNFIDLFLYFSHFKENIRKKCDMYWPPKVGASLSYGDITVTLLSQSNKGDFIYRKMRIEAVREAKFYFNFYLFN